MAWVHKKSLQPLSYSVHTKARKHADYITGKSSKIKKAKRFFPLCHTVRLECQTANGSIVHIMKINPKLLLRAFKKDLSCCDNVEEG